MTGDSQGKWKLSALNIALRIFTFPDFMVGTRHDVLGVFRAIDRGVLGGDNRS